MATNTSGLQHATRDSTGFYGYLVGMKQQGELKLSAHGLSFSML